MKKTLTALSLIMASFTANADVILGGDIEANYWNASATIDGQEVASSAPVITAEASLEHFIPLVPNVKLGTTYMDESELSYQKTDATLYYEILDNDMASFDIGVGVTMLDFKGLKSGGVDLGDVSGTLPSAYVNGEIGIPATPLFVYAKGYVSSDVDTQVVDASIGLQYELGLVVADLEMQAGYRIQNMDLDDFDNTTAKIEMDGFFVGLNLDF